MNTLYWIAYVPGALCGCAYSCAVAAAAGFMCGLTNVIALFEGANDD